MKQIIAIGGGSFATQGTDFKLERYVLAQSKNPTPKICFLGQASAEDAKYIMKFYQSFLQLGAHPSHVSLFGRVEPDWEQHLLSQDIIYVGGGNTRSMLALWREWGMDIVLKKAYEKGVVLAGVSAGAICWFDECVTDSVWPLGIIPGLGILSGSCCPHYDSEPERKPMYIASVNAKTMLPGIALEDFTAAHYINSVLIHCLAGKMNKKAHSVQSQSLTDLTMTLL